MFVEPDYPKGAMLPPGAAVIHVHRDPWEVGRVYPTTIGMVADSRSALAALLEAVRRHMSPGVAEAVRRRRGAIAEARAAREAQRRGPREGPPAAAPPQPRRAG